MSSSDSRRARRAEQKSQRVEHDGVSSHDMALIRAGGALAMCGVIPSPTLPDDVAYSAINAFHENMEPFITLTPKIDARLYKKLGVDSASILPTAIGRFALAVEEGIWFGFTHDADLTFNTLRFTATFFSQELLVPMFGPKMLAWFRQCEHEILFREMDDVLDICEQAIRDQHVPIPANVKRNLTISVDPGEGEWGPSPGGSA